MSAVPREAALPAGGEAAPAAAGKKKKILVIGLAVTLVLAAGGGGAAYYLMKQRAAAAAEAAADGEGGDAEPAAEKLVKASLKSAPTFVALDPFTVNLADRDAERYAQVGISFELANPKDAELLKAYMPAIRNNILLALGAKSATQLNERDGKLRLADEIRREALRPLGYELALPAPGASAVAAKRKRAGNDDDDPALPIRAVHFSNFIIQ